MIGSLTIEEEVSPSYFLQQPWEPTFQTKQDFKVLLERSGSSCEPPHEVPATYSEKSLLHTTHEGCQWLDQSMVERQKEEKLSFCTWLMDAAMAPSQRHRSVINLETGWFTCNLFRIECWIQETFPPKKGTSTQKSWYLKQGSGN